MRWWVNSSASSPESVRLEIFCSKFRGKQVGEVLKTQLFKREKPPPGVWNEFGFEKLKKQKQPTPIQMENFLRWRLWVTRNGGFLWRLGKAQRSRLFLPNNHPLRDQPTKSRSDWVQQEALKIRKKKYLVGLNPPVRIQWILSNAHAHGVSSLLDQNAQFNSSI